MAKRRDYRAEYNRRLERAAKLGYSRRLARGHARSDEYGLAEAKRVSKVANHRVEAGQSKIRSTGREIDEETFRRGQSEAIKLGADVRRIRSLEITDEEDFIRELLDLGYTPHEAYQLRFSPGGGE